MTGVRIKVGELDLPAVTAQCVPRMDNLGNATAVRMQRLVPKRTWALHDTINSHTETSGSRITTYVGFGGGRVNYGLFVEQGTSVAPAQPFARPALLQSKARDFTFEDGPVVHGAVAIPGARGGAVRRGKGRR
jgi:hypothetical protein